MAKSLRVNTTTKRGRPVTTGKGTLIGVRLLDAPLAALDEWIDRQQEPDLSRPEAIRRLVEIGLAVGAKQKQTKAATADRAKELASTAIDSLTGGTPNNDEKANRKGHLIKGPEEFREVRVDRPKGKNK